MNRKMNLTAALVIGSVSAFATSAFAADPTDVGILTISGTVAAVTLVQVVAADDSTPLAAYTTLNLATGESSNEIAHIQEKCNDSDGYKVILTHLNGETGASWLAGAQSEHGEGRLLADVRGGGRGVHGSRSGGDQRDRHEQRLPVVDFEGAGDHHRDRLRG
jgi:hypothetical protein